MTGYLLRRIVYTLISLLLTSIVTFIIIELPPGDYITSMIANLRSRGVPMDTARVKDIEERYGMNMPVTIQYLKWLGNLVQGDLGESFLHNRPVTSLLAERIPLTMLISTLTLLLTFGIAIPIGIYSATHQYSLGDYAVTTVGFVGMATPNFLLALVLMFAAMRLFGISAGGIFSPDFQFAPWSLAKVLDMIKHLPVPIIVVGAAGTAWLIRVMRASLLDELRRQYVITARAKGLTERELLFKYPVRLALNPIVSTIGWELREIVSGETITAVVLSIPTTGPLLLEALRSQDMFLAGSTLLFLSVVTIIGMLISDILLVIVDPRIRLEKGAA